MHVNSTAHHSREIVSSRIEILQCPSVEQDSLRLDGIPEASPWVPDVAAVTDYAATIYVDGRLKAANLVDEGGTGVPAAAGSPGLGMLAYNVVSRLKDVTDGLSQVFLVGEKFLTTDRWTTGTDPADNENMLVGYDNDNYRSSSPVYFPPRQDARASVVAAAGGGNRFFVWGSAHVGGFNMALCDGSVRPIRYTIDQASFARFGNRRDGQPLAYEF